MTTPYEPGPNTSAKEMEQDPAVTTSHPPQRKKLQLKPRSANPSSSRRPRTRSLSSKSDPFGAAVPREQVLEKRGVDVKQVDDKIERKAAVIKFTVAQEKEIESVRVELTKATEDLRNANENELPEEEFRVQEEAKRKELNDLMEKFSKLNASDSSSDDKRQPRHYSTHQRPSSYRNRANNQSHHQHNYEEGYDSYRRKSGSGRGGWQQDNNNYYDGKEEKDEGGGDEAFSNFHSNRRRHRSEEQEHQTSA